jgi:hypothetical protein
VEVVIAIRLITVDSRLLDMMRLGCRVGQRLWKRVGKLMIEMLGGEKSERMPGTTHHYIFETRRDKNAFHVRVLVQPGYSYLTLCGER